MTNAFPPLELTFFRSVDAPREGKRRSFSRVKLEQWFREPKAAAAATKRELPVWCAAIFEGDARSKASVVRVTALVFDFDGVELPMLELLRALPVACMAHTSWSHGEKPGHCFRLLIPVSRPLNADEHARLWPLVARALEQLGARVDGAAKDPGRAWFVPCARQGYESACELERDLFDVDEALRAVASEEASRPEPQGEAWRAREGRSASPPTVLERASKYLATKEPAISGQAGHHALFSAALAMVRGFALEQGDAVRLLVNEYNPRCVPPWEHVDIERKVREAAKAEGVGFGYLLDERRAS